MDLRDRAELIGASSGIGHMITDSQALLNTGQIIFGIIVIGVSASCPITHSSARTSACFPWASTDRACAAV
jgi:NitT/TauT family transport system permease protein